MLGTGTRSVLDTEIVHSETEGGAVGAVTEKSGHMRTLLVAMVTEMSDKMLLGDGACLWETIHGLIYLHQDMSIMYIVL